MKASRILFIVVLILSICSCKDEFLNYDDSLVEEGLPAHVVLKFASQDNTVVTRAERDSLSEYRVDNLYLFIFDERGNVHERKFCTPGNGLSYKPGSYQEGKAEIATKSINHAHIVGIANVTIDGKTSTAYNVTEDDLKSITTYSDLENKVMRMTENSIERYAIFMLTGMAEDEDGNTDIQIPGTEGGTPAVLNCALKLRRTDAKIKFVVKTNNSHGYKDFSFSPRSWVVKRVPAQSYILPKESGDYDGQDAVYFTSPERPFEVIDRNKDNPKLYSGGSFVYYMPENRKKPLKLIEGGEEAYALREKWEGTDKDGDKNYVYANENSTYVEITGLLSYYNDEGQNTNADIRFIVHLGNPNEKRDGSYDVNNYNTNRNTFYTYNITICGVEDIKVEVVQENEIRPGYEGDVVDTENRAFVFDSHYDRCLIKINPASIPAESEGEIYWSVNTPFSRGVHTVSDAKVPKEMRDYRWIKFAVNAEYGEEEDKYVKYPGDQNYDDPYPVSGDPFNESSPYYSTGEGYKTGWSDIIHRNFDSREARLLDINQLMKYLQKLKGQNVNNDITITVFVDENLYFKHPITGEENTDHRSFWKLTSDKEDRIMYLVINKPTYSGDGNSSVVKAEYSFRQRTIRTIFNVDKPELNTAWGLESEMETGRLPVGDVSQGTDTRNGRQNCLKWLENKKWTDIVDVSTFDPNDPKEAYKLKESYNNAAYACMLRNRDLNGDNIVDAREIRWYLAAIDQLTDIYLGEYALDEQSRLYPSNPADRENMIHWHYTSSSYNGGDKNPWVLWAEEGASRGTFKNSTNLMKGKFNYRCVRNLGLSLDHPEEDPTDLIKVTDEGNGVYLIDVTNMNIKSRRTSYVTVLPAHNERSDINRPYAKFRVYNKCYGGDGKEPHLDSWLKNEWNDYPWNYYQTHDPSPQGYRIPNQRELLIMTTRMPNDAWETFSEDSKKIRPNYVSQTSFSLNGIPPFDSKREGFLWDSNNGFFFLQNSTSDEGYVRPIQDIKD